MAKKGKKAQAGKPKKLTPKEIGKRLNALVVKLEKELEGADLFAPLLPPTEDCPICLVPLPRKSDSIPVVSYQACCGKKLCSSCFKQSFPREEVSDKTCPFCRSPATFYEEYALQLEDRASKNDHTACQALGEAYFDGCYRGMPKDKLKAIGYYIQAVELGSADVCVKISGYYRDTEENILPVDRKRASLFDAVGAIRGDVACRYNIGLTEYDKGNHEIGIRHWKITAEAGYQASLDALKEIYNSNGKMAGKEFISMEDMNRVYRVCHEAQEEVKSEERENFLVSVSEAK